MKRNTPTPTRLFREAIRYTTANVKTVAEESGYARPTFDKYLRERPPTLASVEALAAALDRRADKLCDYAQRLRAAIE